MLGNQYDTVVLVEYVISHQAFKRTFLIRTDLMNLNGRIRLEVFEF